MMKKISLDLIRNKGRIDKGYMFLVKTILFNNRLRYYDAYLRLAKEKGYKIVSYIEFLEKYQNSSDKILILRHDIDNHTYNIRSMLEIEKSVGARASYYFRWLTFDKELMQEINKSGFEVGFHYETLGQYCEENDISEVNDEIIKKCKKQLNEEIKLFKEKSQINIKTIANHGHPRNCKLHVSNNVLVEEQNYEDFGIISETYDKDFYNKVTTHIMDTDIAINYGFAYNSNPIESILDNDRVIVFVSHPEHWRFSLFKRLRLMARVILFKYTTTTSRNFMRVGDNNNKVRVS